MEVSFQFNDFGGMEMCFQFNIFGVWYLLFHLQIQEMIDDGRKEGLREGFMV